MIKSRKAIILGIFLMLIAAITASVGIDEVTRQVGEAAIRAIESGKKNHYVRMDKFMIPVIQHNKVSSHIDLTIDIEVVDEEQMKLVEQATPRLRNAIIHDLSIVALWPDENGNIRLAIGDLKKRLLVICENILGPGVIRNLLVNNLLERKL